MEVRQFPTTSGPWAQLLAGHWPLLLVLCGAAFLLFADLGGDHLWADEGDTAVLASSILKYGVPRAWDGVTFTDSDFGARENEDLVMVSHPWLQYYVTAAAFLVFGETSYAARFPFALAGLLTIVVLYVLVLSVTADKRAALSAALLLALSVQFLLFSRQSRNYSLHMLLACALLLSFFRLHSWRASLSFSAVAIALFHCNPAGIATLGALAILTGYAPCRQYRRWFWRAAPLVAVGTLPWVLLANAGYRENTVLLQHWTDLLLRLLQVVVECASVTPLVGVLALWLFLWYRHRKPAQAPSLCAVECPTRLPRRQSSHRAPKRKSPTFPPLFTAGERMFLALVGALFASYAILLALTQSQNDMWSNGLRFMTPIIPLMMGLAGVLVSKASGARLRVWAVLMLMLGVTKVGHITPWLSFDNEPFGFNPFKVATVHTPRSWTATLFWVELISFSRGLWHENPGTVAAISAFLSANAHPGDIVITNYEWEPLYFHTRLPQGLKIMPDYPIYATAQRHGLPPYVFSVAGVRWVVWRWPWDGYRRYHWDAIRKTLLESGATVTKVQSLPETGWENRPELHLHRFSKGKYTYPYPSGENDSDGVLNDAEIFRVDWPAGAPSAGAPQNDHAP